VLLELEPIAERDVTCHRQTIKLFAGFPLYFGIKIQGLSRTLKLHFQGPIFDGSLQHGQYYSNI